MMRFTFNLFTQVSDLGPHGPLVAALPFRCASLTSWYFLVHSQSCDTWDTLIYGQEHFIGWLVALGFMAL